MVNLGTGEVLQAEAWGLCHGLQLALQHGVSKVICESDSAVLVNLVLDADIEVHPLGTIIRICRCLMQQFSSCSLSHVHRERNFVADGLAKASLSREKGIYFFENVPDCVSAAMEDDEKGMAKMRRVPAHCVQDYAGTDSDGCSRNGDMVDVELGVQGGQGCGLVGSAERGKWDGIGCAAAWGVMSSSKSAVAVGLSSERFCMDGVDAGREGNVMDGVEAECSTRAQAKVAVADAILASQPMKEAGVVPGKGSRVEDFGAIAGPVACAASFPSEVEIEAQRGNGCGLARGSERGMWSGSVHAAALGRMSISKADVGAGVNTVRYVGAGAEAERGGNDVAGVVAGYSSRNQAKDIIVDAVFDDQAMEEAGVVPGGCYGSEACCSCAAPVVCGARHPCKACASSALGFPCDPG